MSVVIVCGGRDFADHGLLKLQLDDFHAQVPITLLVQGGANGADKLAEGWAEYRGIHYARVPALWQAHGRAAGPKRNEIMLRLRPEWVIAFPGGRGTAHMVSLAREARLNVLEVKP